MNNDNEIWKDVNGYEGYYKVSNFGNVKSCLCHKNRTYAGGYKWRYEV